MWPHPDCMAYIVTRASQAERVGVVGSAPSGGSMWGQHPRLMPNLPEDHSNPSKVIKARGCLSLLSRRPLPTSPWGQAGVGQGAHALGCLCLSACSQKQNSQFLHMLMWVLLLIHTVSLSCGHTVGLLFYRQLVAQASSSVLSLITLSPLRCASGRSYLQEQTLWIPTPPQDPGFKAQSAPWVTLQCRGRGSSFNPSPFLKSQPHYFCQGGSWCESLKHSAPTLGTFREDALPSVSVPFSP